MNIELNEQEVQLLSELLSFDLKEYIGYESEQVDVFENILEKLESSNEVVEDIPLDEIGDKIIEETDMALKMFGEYSFGDKGPHEVMDVDSISDMFENKDIQDVARVLSFVLDNYHLKTKVGSHDPQWVASSIVEALIHSLDDREDFDELFQYDDRFEY
jgi:hypothetical protein